MSVKSPGKGHPEDGDRVLSRQPRSVKDLEGRLRYNGPQKTLNELDAGIAQGAAESLEWSRRTM